MSKCLKIAHKYSSWVLPPLGPLPYLWSLQSGCWGSWSAPSRGFGSWTGWGRSLGWGAPAGSCWPTGMPEGCPGRGGARWSQHRGNCCSGRCRWTPPELDRNRSASSTHCCSGRSYWSWSAWYDSDSWWRRRWWGAEMEDMNGWRKKSRWWKTGE